ncbi:hypothetical protein V8C42DRAFT_167501 [Trichoderma barbatum]
MRAIRPQILVWTPSPASPMTLLSFSVPAAASCSPCFFYASHDLGGKCAGRFSSAMPLCGTQCIRWRSHPNLAYSSCPRHLQSTVLPSKVVVVKTHSPSFLHEASPCFVSSFTLLHLSSLHFAYASPVACYPSLKPLRAFTFVLTTISTTATIEPSSSGTI